MYACVAGEKERREGRGLLFLTEAEGVKSAPRLCSQTAGNYSALSCCCRVNLSGFSRTNLLHMEKPRVERREGGGGEGVQKGEKGKGRGRSIVQGKGRGGEG